jgi:hypothetical protein
MFRNTVQRLLSDSSPLEESGGTSQPTRHSNCEHNANADTYCPLIFLVVVLVSVEALAWTLGGRRPTPREENVSLKQRDRSQLWSRHFQVRYPRFRFAWLRVCNGGVTFDLTLGGLDAGIALLRRSATSLSSSASSAGYFSKSTTDGVR